MCSLSQKTHWPHQLYWIYISLFFCFYEFLNEKLTKHKAINFFFSCFFTLLSRLWQTHQDEFEAAASTSEEKKINIIIISDWYNCKNKKEKK